ncbi:hypothetical protein G6F24_012952 [Rhizopus arrhizus]|nr:hypothetical protein G6F24_012952 [Rhizopus arrhizus]
MLRCLRVPASALLLSALLVPTVHAGAAPQLNSSQASVIVTSFVVLSLPMAASMGLSELSKAPFKASERNGKATRTKAVPLPPMEVKKVETTPEGERQVQLQVPDKADHTATLAKLLALPGATWGLVKLRGWLRLATFQSGGLTRSLVGAARAAIGLDSAMALRRGPAGALRMLSLWNRTLAPLLRVAFRD